jgi:hypothetical protein
MGSIFTSFHESRPNLDGYFPDLTNGTKEGNVAFGTIATISESQLQFGLLYTGSDDGLIYVSKMAV